MTEMMEKSIRGIVKSAVRSYANGAKNILIETKHGLWMKFSSDDFDFCDDGYCEHRYENISFNIDSVGNIHNMNRYICDLRGEIIERIPLRYYVQ